MIELWRGGVSLTDCDAMGHMNVAYYGDKAMLGLAELAARLGLDPSRIAVAETNTRFLKEARSGAPLYLTGGVVDLSDETATLVFLLHHLSGDVAAGHRMKVVCRGGWPEQARAAAADLMVEAPEHAIPRGVPDSALTSEAGLARAKSIGMPRTGLAPLTKHECDAQGVTETALMVRIAQAIAQLFNGAPPGAPDAEGRIGGVTLEQRQVVLARPGPGARIETRSAVVAREGRLRRTVHWLIDLSTGEAVVRAETLVAAFDLASRRLMPPDPQPTEPEPLAGAAI